MIEKIKEKIMQDRRIGRNSLEAFLEILKEVEAEYNNGWIPCSERLPEKRGIYYAVTVKDKIYGFVHSRPAIYDEMGFAVTLFEEVIAWMPLPEPYKPIG